MHQFLFLYAAYSVAVVHSGTVISVALAGQRNSARQVALRDGESWAEFVSRSIHILDVAASQQKNVRIYDEERCEIKDLHELDDNAFVWLEPREQTAAVHPDSVTMHRGNATQQKAVEQRVRGHYESYPYPRWRNSDRPSCRWTSDLRQAMAIGWGGKAPLSSFRALIAGGGTGMETNGIIQELREIDELKGSQLQVVHLDLSMASLEIAKRHTESCNTTGVDVTFVQGSILDVATLGLGQFDYIRCTGVLHHMKSPLAGLRALTRTLKPEGLMGVMVYGKYGRTGIEEGQRMFQMIESRLDRQGSPEERLDRGRRLVQNLPRYNWLRRNGYMLPTNEKAKVYRFSVNSHFV